MKLLRPCLPLLVCLLSTAAFAQDNKPAEEKGKGPGKEAKEEAKPSKEEKPKEISAQVTIGGQVQKYIAQTGTIPVLKDDGTPRAKVFYVYYAATDAEGKRLAAKDAAARPIMFCFNGGPGASAVWLHLGGLGPKRLDLPADGLTPSSVLKVVENQNSILDVADLVFVDPVGTGVSRAAPGEKPEQFFGVDEDIQAVGEFVRLFTTREQRWTSPKYLLGESYGVLRVGGLSDYLQEKHGLYCEGVVLMSGILSFQTLNAHQGNDLPYVVFLPGLAATAHYHKKLSPEKQADFEGTIAAARKFAQTDYLVALQQGANLPEEQRKKIAETVAGFIGLTPQQVLEQDLRVDSSYFRKMLLRDQGKIVGRFDARVTGEDGNLQAQTPEFDPSFSNIIGGFSSSVNAYVRGELGYESDHPYRVLAPLPWKWSNFENRYVSTEVKLADALKNNPRLRVLVQSSYRDLACPEDAVAYSISHMSLPASARQRISTVHYESGHMMYLFGADAVKLRKDLVDFVKAAK